MRRLLFGSIAALSLAALIPWTLKAADSTLSGLSSGGAVSGTDLFYDVQSVGVGGVKVTGTQLKNFMSASPSFTGTASFPDNGTWSAAGITGTIGEFTTVNIGGIATGTQCLHASPTGLVSGTGADCGNATFSIAAGTNITTSGTASNVTVNVVATPSFTTIIATGNTTGTTGNFTTSLSSGTATFQTVTINNLTPAGPNCLQEIGGVVQATNAACGSGGGSTTSIAAGTNITTSGTSTNVTVNVVATPSFTTVISTSNLTASTVLGVVGWVTGPGANFQTMSLAGNLTGTLASFTNLTATGNGSIAALTGSSLNFVSGTITTLTGTNNWVTNLTATNAVSVAALTGSNLNFVSGTITTLTNTNHWVTSLTSTNSSMGTLTAGSGTFQTLTVNSLTPTGPNCLQETGGVVQATNSACTTATNTQINAGQNITTSGSASSVTINATPTGPSTAVQYVSSANGQFGGDSGFTYAGGQGIVSIVPTASSAGLSLTLGALTTNTKALNIIGSWASSGITYDAPLFMNIATTSFAVGSRLADIQASGVSVFSVSASGALASAALQSAATQCLQASTGGLINGTGSACGSGGSTPATGGPVLPTSEYLGGASGNLAPTFYIPTSGISNQGALEGIGLATTATSTLATAVLQFNMPEIIPTNPMRLRLLYMADASAGNVSTWIQDALTSASSSLGSSTLTSETTKVIAITTQDIMIEKKFALTQTPTAGSNQILTVLLNLTTSVAQTVVIQPSIIWE